MSLDADDGHGSQERTMVVDARLLKRSSKTWRPYTFSKLEKVSLNESRLVGRLKWLTPKPEAAEALCARLKSIFDTQVGFTQESVRVLAPAEVRRHLAEPTFLSFLVPGAHRGRAVLEVELALAHAAVDTLLGGAGETVGLRPLTDIEEGVAGFVLLEALKALAPGMDPGQPKLRLEGVASGVDEAAARLGEEGPVLMVQLRAKLGSQDGMVRLFVPSGVMEAMEPAQESEQRRAMLQVDRRAHLGRLSAVRSWVRAEIGLAEISSQDLSSLRVKDVVLVDEFSARPDRGEEGTARLRLGLGRQGYMNAEVFVENGEYQARITEVVLGEQPFLQRNVPSESDEAAAESLSESGESGDDEEFTNPEMSNPQAESGAVDDRMDSGELLGDIPLQISVELARVPVTADQVVSLRAGQVLELHRAPGEAVDLSVNGKVIARGELVEIEGQLGVRILSLAG
ncbi:type III secretion system cytoplasmic ring protein SctQ [Vitiosangium sp. GDMCC 1.1324]|uniref:type III secretion system cytoplasmic ring protein SctQ n=1 Tax=Vitiosangium sp. (strain GDMCC 1.1324) TaxID=2138576 RepID=UPI000D393C88|nr:type III secretion system cytoplasmic ring protein SctQ [Vitiosangium sp. GDMCC 1.1324]PTL80508.1 YscQ/HrcQ family type III secretion apparatus protein [Vitiosangium sp. GDMCC 1.1324]